MIPCETNMPKKISKTTKISKINKKNNFVTDSEMAKDVKAIADEIFKKDKKGNVARVYWVKDDKEIKIIVGVFDIERNFNNIDYESSQYDMTIVLKESTDTKTEMPKGWPTTFNDLIEIHK